MPADPSASQTTATPPKLGIVAGSGELPAKVIAACREQARPFYVLALKGHADHPDIHDAPHSVIRLGAARAAEKIARAEGIEDVVLAGAVRRPSLRDIRPDGRALRFLVKAGFRALGDDSLLSAIVKELEAEGLRVLGVHEIVEELLAAVGPFGKHEPDASADQDIDRAIAVARGLGKLDVGQAAVVQQGIVLGVEAIEGTDALLARCAELRRKGAGGVLVKLQKPGQDRRVDLPTIGVRTVEGAAAAGLRGIAVEAGATLVIDPDAIARAADKAKLFVVGLDAARIEQGETRGAR